MIVLLTYDHPHRKTSDVLWRLLAEGHRPKIVATPWKERKERDFIYAHRPAESGWPCTPNLKTPEGICENLELEYIRTDTLDQTLNWIQPNVVVVGGAGILPEDVVTNFKVLNAHPGLLPARRGYDVLKWCIHDCVQVGVTAHLCDKHTDLGRRMAEIEVPVFAEDTFHAFAMRQYEMELDLLSLAVDMVKSGETGDVIHPSETQPFKRMPKEVEATLMQRFEDYKRVFS